MASANRFISKFASSAAKRKGFSPLLFTRSSCCSALLSPSSCRSPTTVSCYSQQFHQEHQLSSRHLLSFRNPHRTMVTITKTSASTSAPIEDEDTHLASASSNTTNTNIIHNSINDNEHNITITPSAIQQIHHLAKQKRPDSPDTVYLRVYVDAGGCSGFEYKFELEFKDDEEEGIDLEEDVLFPVSTNLNDNGDDNVISTLVVIDQASLKFMEGSTLDFVREMIRSSFAIVENPLSESACGCGSSFAVKNFEQSQSG